MSDRNQVSNIIARLYDYIDSDKTKIFILISIFVFLSPILEDWQLFGNKLTKLFTFILVAYCILVVIGFVNKYRNKKDIKVKIEGIKELYKHKIGNIIYYSLQNTIKVINKLLKHLGKKEINSKKRMSSIIKASNKVLKHLGRKEIKFNDFRINQLQEHTQYTWIDSGRIIFFISVILISIKQLVNLIKEDLTFLDTSNNLENLLFNLSLTGFIISVSIISWISGIEAAKRNNIVPKILSEMFKLNYKELTISRPEGSLIINPTKNYEDGYYEFLAKGKNKNTTVGRILKIIHNWSPRNADIEGDYRDRCEIQLKKFFPPGAVEPEKKIGEKQGQGIIDIKVDEVLIELKSDDSLNARYRAVGQVNHYSKTHKGPIILLLFDYEKKSAEHYTELMENMWKNGQPIITVIAKEKKSG